MKPLSWPWPVYSNVALARVANLIQSGQVNQLVCDTVEALESVWASQFDCDHVIAVTNGTHALELSLMALGIGPGDEVIVPARCFIACATAIMRVGATPVFADVDPRTQGLNRETVAPLINRRTRAILLVHLGGHPASLLADVEWVRQNRLILVEDCSQAVGARYRNQYVGTFGDIACASLCNEKNISAGEGGIVQTSSVRLANKIRQLRNHGQNQHGAGRAGEFIFQRRIPGSNYRLSPLAAALALDHLEQWPELFSRRVAIARACRAALAESPYFEVPEVIPDETPSWYRVYFAIRQDYWPQRSNLISALHKAGIPLASVSCPDVRLEPMFDGKVTREPLPHSRDLGEAMLALPAYPTLSDEDLMRLLDRIKGFRLSS
ncbi:MAG: DegT/DnrJ/EryC1/StrS family aminotransferase [Gammaproteobacteria bacterium]|nr:MAG: DegT/DnrJ/EryC1/StrS family aminotransferase [Gammaproteobacteria bacterium]